MSGRAAINFHKDGKVGAYFFHNEKVVEIRWSPDQNNDKIVHGPVDFAKEWPALKEAGFSRIDAILPILGHTNRAYFFCGKQYARIEFTPGNHKEQKIIGKVLDVSNWRSLAQAGFETVEAALIEPGTTNQAFFFSGTKLVLVQFKETESSGDKLLEGPSVIHKQWSKLGFSSIDTIIPDTSAQNQAYVFSGHKAARITLVPGGGVEVLNGPVPAAEYWPSLHQAGFY